MRILKYNMLLNYYRVLLCSFTSQALHQSIFTVLPPYVLLNIE